MKIIKAAKAIKRNISNTIIPRGAIEINCPKQPHSSKGKFLTMAEATTAIKINVKVHAIRKATGSHNPETTKAPRNNSVQGTTAAVSFSNKG